MGKLSHSEHTLKEGGTDWVLLLAVWLLLSFGLIFVYSSSAMHAMNRFGDPTHYFYSHLTRCLIGLLLLWGLTRIQTESLRKHALVIFCLSACLLIAVLVPGIGLVKGGARRWLSLGFMTIQPSELAKLAAIIATAAILTKRELMHVAERKSLLVPAMLAQIPVVLVLAEPDLGTALVIELIVGVMIFVAGVRLRVLAMLLLAVLPVFYHLLLSTPFRLRRLLAYVDPWAYRQTVGYQLSEALISVGSGGFFGLGLGEGKHGLFFLPEAHTDFIFAIVAQELGYFGVLILLSAFVVILWRSLNIVLYAGSPFERYLGAGLLALIFVPTVFNLAVVTGLLPTKGLPLPFISYGGSNLVVTLAAVGLLLRIRKGHVATPASEARG